MATGKRVVGAAIGLGVAAAALAVLLMSGEREAPHQIKLEKGVYQGKADTPLPPGTDSALRQRGLLQRAD
ncbi:hypothetical protein [Roseibium aggregatum]|uniref:Uncharacterized protein n=1 Tax=Roseibium aggregatum TaxID=187304 RepID=A0A926P4N6_9HYPH|nr:hypothetical protein [Roseibium aggregatum]MBD1549433.1 hypothetical protein [Roseibium aggregatum]